MRYDWCRIVISNGDANVQIDAYRWLKVERANK